MRRRDISGLVAPNRPRPERNLANDQADPKDRQLGYTRDTAPISPNTQTKPNDRNCNQQREKAVRHLQPDLERVHVR